MKAASCASELGSFQIGLIPLFNVFTQLTRQEDHMARARKIVEVVFD